MQSRRTCSGTNEAEDVADVAAVTKKLALQQVVRLNHTVGAYYGCSVGEKDLHVGTVAARNIANEPCRPSGIHWRIVRGAACRVDKHDTSIVGRGCWRPELPMTTQSMVLGVCRNSRCKQSKKSK